MTYIDTTTVYVTECHTKLKQLISCIGNNGKQNKQMKCTYLTIILPETATEDEVEYNYDLNVFVLIVFSKYIINIGPFTLFIVPLSSTGNIDRDLCVLFIRSIPFYAVRCDVVRVLQYSS